MNYRNLIRGIIVFYAAVLAFPSHAEEIDELLDQAIAGEHRDTAFAARDQYRHPRETLKFLGLQPDMTVVEIWPGMGWYTELLAPVLRDKGILYAAGFSMTAKRTPDWRKDMQTEFTNKLAGMPEVYDYVVVTELAVPERTTIAPPGTVDMILTFRNVHNWMKGDYAEGMLKTFYRTLKPGGILGIVEHRAAPGTPLDKMIESGYVTEEFVKALAMAVGFEFEESSEINANPADTKDHPAGVWTLPPSLRYCNRIKEGSSKDECIKKYTAIGESDRMTLRFRKP